MFGSSVEDAIGGKGSRSGESCKEAQRAKLETQWSRSHPSRVSVIP